ncbi:MAG: DUF308 domain-containing protein [Eubacterium sp.]
MSEKKGTFGSIENELKGTIKHWWVFLILGVLAMGVGIWLMFTPLNGFAALSILFAITFLVAGISSCAVTLINRKTIAAWGWNLAMGIIMLIFGVIMVTNLAMSAEALVFYLAFAIMFSGFNSIGFSFTAKKSGDHRWGWNLALGILVVISSMVLMFHPVFAAFTLVIWASIAFISMGISFLVLAYTMSKAKGEIKK